MNRKARHTAFAIPGTLFALFVLYTAALLTIDVLPIGPEGSRVGFATMNRYMFELFGENALWQGVTEALGVAAMLTAAGFFALGLSQWIRRKRLRRVDRDLLVLAAFYIAVAAAYAFFEVFIVNYRPILIDGALEASYPSSHTMLVCCTLSTAIIQFRDRISSAAVRACAQLLSMMAIVITVIGRLLSGVHWFSDILGSLLLSAALVALYCATLKQFRRRRRPRYEAADGKP